MARDRHVLAAVLAALPVWGVLWAMDGAGGGPPGERVGWALLYLAGITPLLEELAFRGALQGWLLETGWGAVRVGGLSLANLACSALFAVMHLGVHSPVWAASVVIPSLVFGHLRDRTGSTVPAILVHGWYNLGYFTLMG